MRNFLLFSSLLLLLLLLPTSSASDAARRPPSPPASAVFPLIGNVYPDGQYFAAVNIGGKPYFLDIDTGSDLTWLQCDAPCVHCNKGPHPWYKPRKSSLVPCGDPLCAALQESAALEGHHNACADPAGQCDYEIEYADHSSSLGVLVEDAFSILLTNGSRLRTTLAFGCGYDQGSGAGELSVTDGVLGLGIGRSSTMSQLRDRGIVRGVMGHCLGRRGGGFLFLGDTVVPKSGVAWTAMSDSRAIRSYYTAEPAKLLLGEQTLVSSGFQVSFDSGSTYTYFARKPYEIFIAALEKDLRGKPVKAADDDDTLPVCWKGPKTMAECRSYFRSVFLRFRNGKGAVLEIPPEGYLIFSKFGSVCLGILNGTENGLKDLNVIGDVSMQDYLVIYDNERDRIGWMHTICDRKTESGYDAGFGFNHLDTFCHPRADRLSFSDLIYSKE